MKKHSKNYNRKRPLPPPPSYTHVPFEVPLVIINDAFYEPPRAAIHSATRATLAGARITEVMGEKAGWMVWDEAPSGHWQKTIVLPEGEVFGTSCLPTYHPHGPLWGIEFLLAPAPKPSEWPPKRARMSVMDSWLQAAGPRKDCEQADAEKKIVRLGGLERMHFLLHQLFFVMSSSCIAAALSRAAATAAGHLISSGHLLAASISV